MRTLRVAATVLFLMSSVGAQGPAFEAASVKRRTEPGGGFVGRRPGGRFVAEGASLQQLIEFAYRLQRYQISGGPGWLSTERWDVNATGAATAPNDVLAAVQQLLADRFSLVVRHEMRELQVYALMLARRDAALGVQLKRSPIDCAALQAEAMRTGVVPVEARGRCTAQGRVGSPTRRRSRAARSRLAINRASIPTARRSSRRSRNSWD